MNVSVDGKTHGEHSKYKGFEAFFLGIREAK